jgi:hypothetical protein
MKNEKKIPPWNISKIQSKNCRNGNKFDTPIFLNVLFLFLANFFINWNLSDFLEKAKKQYCDNGNLKSFFNQNISVLLQNQGKWNLQISLTNGN